MNAQILIVEDEVIIGEFLASIIKSAGYQNVQLVHSAEEGAECLENVNYDLAIFDIRMEEEESGLKLANLLNLRQESCPLLFITAQSDPVLMAHALKKKPYAYLTKPIKKPDVIAAVSLALAGTNKKEEARLQFKDGWEMVQLKKGEVIYLEADGNYVKVVTPKKNYLVRYTLSWFKDQLNEPRFVQIHRSRLVNFDYVEKIGQGSVRVFGVELDVSKSGAKNLKALMN